ncbi:MAG: guanylate kinase [bacterium]|nr:guanylate kinase [bacterium]
MLFVLSAPSGTGKTTVAQQVLSALKKIRQSISVTTRPLREGEKNGVDYTFVSLENFQDKKSAGGFLEWAEVHGFFYGTPRELVEQNEKEGIDTLLVIDVQGGLKIKKVCPEAVLIFLLPPSLEELEKRLSERGTESEEMIQKRLKNAHQEMLVKDLYDYVIINEDLERAISEVKKAIEKERLRHPCAV